MRLRRAARRAGPLVLGALLIAGCSEGSPGTAASVGSESLTVAEVQERTAGFLEAYPEAKSSGVTADLIASVTVENFIRAAVVDAVAAESNLSVSETQIEDFISQLGGLEEVTRRTSSRGIPPDEALVRAEVRSAVLQRAIGEATAGEGASEDDISIATRDTIDAKTAELDIEVNPRYGSWDGSTVEGTGSLSKTAKELAGGPAATAVIPPG